MKNKIKRTEYIKVSEIRPEILRKHICSEVGEKATDVLYNYLKLDLTLNYPNFKEWYYNTVIPELNKEDGEREIIIALSEMYESFSTEITGIAILKRREHEKKICTIRIHENYRNLGIGTQLFKECFKYLGTEKPIITISEDREELFKKHIEKFGFKKVSVIKDLYRNGISEIIYNGDFK